MSLERELAQRFLYETDETVDGEHSRPRRKRYRPVVRLSIIGIALGVTLILLSLFIVNGFKQELHQKLNGFTGTVRISNPENNYDQYSVPLTLGQGFIDELTAVSHQSDARAQVTTFVQQMGMLKTDSAFQTLILHGTAGEVDPTFMEEYLTEGRMPSDASEATLSRPVATRLGLNIGDEILIYFLIDEAMRMRKLELVGLYETGFEAYDQNILFADHAMLQQVAHWSDQQVSGVSITLPSTKGAEGLFDTLYDFLYERSEQYGERYAMFTVEELHHDIFGWLGLLDANILLILVLMIAVAGMTIITGIVVLMLQKVRTIATLKALGYRDSRLRRIFGQMGLKIVLRGMVLANILALVLSAIQLWWKPLRLDPSQYYMTHVPISIDLAPLLITNAVVFVLVLLFILIPTRIISRLKPSDALRFE